MKTRNIITLVIIAVILIAIGTLVATTIDVTAMLPIPAMANAAHIVRLFRTMLGIATVIFLFVEGGFIYAVFRFRRKRGDTSEGAAIHGNTP